MTDSAGSVTSERVMWGLREFPHLQREEVAFHIRIEVISPFMGGFGNAIVYHAVDAPQGIGPTNLKKKEMTR